MPYLVDQGGSSDRAALQLTTRDRQHIPNETHLEMPPAQLRAIADNWRRARPEARPRSFTGVYNCMGMVFASRRTWIDIEQLSMILRGDGYRQLNAVYELEPGDVVVYGQLKDKVATHVGCVAQATPQFRDATKKIEVLSKWGQAAEYLHDIGYVPDVFGVPIQFWTDRRPLP